MSSTLGRAFFAFVILIPLISRAQDGLSGTLSAHDPSTLIKDGNTYRYFATGNGISSRRSTNLTSWNSGPSVFSTIPAWTTTAVPGFAGNFWAPEVSYFGGLYHLYYAVSTFGSQVSAIGMATNPTLNNSASNYLWTDQGAIIQSQVGSAYNAIDPSIFRDTDGSMWMTFGSFWNGIYETQLNPSTGKLLNSSVAPKQVANKSQIEASYIFKKDNYYYLFVNWGLCCQGSSSTYNIRVGRSTSVDGPFLDQNGVDLRSGGGSLFLGTEGNFIGPGQMGIYTENGQDYFSFHYYNGANNGSATYDLRKLYWSANNWPSAVFVPEPAMLTAIGILFPLLSRRTRRSPL